MSALRLCRIYPPVTMNCRILDEDTVIGGFVIPKQVRVNHDFPQLNWQRFEVAAHRTERGALRELVVDGLSKLTEAMGRMLINADVRGLTDGQSTDTHWHSVLAVPPSPGANPEDCTGDLSKPAR